MFLPAPGGGVLILELATGFIAPLEVIPLLSEVVFSKDLVCHQIIRCCIKTIILVFFLTLLCILHFQFSAIKYKNIIELVLSKEVC